MMMITSIQRTTFSSLALVLAVSACDTSGAEQDDLGFATDAELDAQVGELEEPGLDDVDDEDAPADETGTEADEDDEGGLQFELTAPPDASEAAIPPPGSSFTYIGRGHLLNGTGLCAFRSGNIVSTAACSSHASQLFDAYQTSDGRYNVCVPDSLRTEDFTDGCGAFACFSEKATGANCIGQFSKDAVRVYGMPMDFHRPTGLDPQPGELGYEADQTVTLRTGRRLTRNSGGVLVPGSHSGQPNQTWTVF